jgi:uncharacterized protein YbbC (DUF1343 family)
MTRRAAGHDVTVRFGVDRVIAEPSLLEGARRVGLVTNDAARLAGDSAVRARTALIAAGVPVVRLFGPEHGVSGQAVDGAVVPDGIDALTSLPIVSLYGERMRPSHAMLADLGAVLFDVQDIGTRYYTYAWTLLQVMEACADAHVPLVVLDRPNPLGGRLEWAEGPMLDRKFGSFIGGDSIPIRHSLTIGELARLWARERWPQASVRVIECEGWRRDMLWSDTGLPFVPTSPSIPSFDSALLYPALCYFEATNLSAGRGTDSPFQHVGAPWLEPNLVVESMKAHGLGGVTFEPETFVPSSAVYVGERCTGVRVRVTDHAAVRPVALGLLLLAAVAETHRSRFSWWKYPTAVNPVGENHFERLVGRAGIRERIDSRERPVGTAEVAEWTRTDDWSVRVDSAPLYR